MFQRTGYSPRKSTDYEYQDGGAISAKKEGHATQTDNLNKKELMITSGSILLKQLPQSRLVDGKNAMMNNNGQSRGAYQHGLVIGSLHSNGHKSGLEEVQTANLNSESF